MVNANKVKGATFERLVITYLREWFKVDRTRVGWADDRGDIHGVVDPDGRPFVFECKNYKTMALAGWMTELRTEVANAGGVIGAIVHKRKGVSNAQEQYVTMPLEFLVILLKQAKYE